MKETTCHFGKQNRLKGILTSPSSETRTDITLILITAGFVMMSGPFRIYTLLARKAVDLGIRTLRFDLGGIGISEQIHTGLTIKQRTDKDIAAAIEFLDVTNGKQQFVLFGICSGAEDSFRYAEQDSRVKGVVMVDPHSYKTSGWKWRHIFSRYRFNKAILKIVKLLDHSQPDEDYPYSNFLENNDNLVDYQYMNIEESSGILKKMIARKTLVHYIYTGGALSTFNHKSQLAKMFKGIDFEGIVTLRHLPQIGHTQLLEEDRDLLIEEITKWIFNSFKCTSLEKSSARDWGGLKA